ncbi:hypothetical protein ACI2LF_12980 [Kribbella sp. NPDC020789]
MSVVVLECTAEDYGLAFRTLERFLKEPGRERAGKESDIVALSGGDDAGGLEAIGGAGIDQIAGFVRRHRQPPAWVIGDADFTDVVHDLTVLLRRERLVAVHTASDVDARLQRWLDRQPAPPYRRMRAEVLEGALLQGEARGLWLRGTQKRTRTRADTKNLGGMALQDALNPIEDSSYAMGSAKADLLDDPSRTVLRGAVGTTPRNSSVWFKSSADLHWFAAAVVELLTALESASAAATADTLSVLARAVDDVTGVWGAYDFSLADPDLLPGDDEEMRAAAELLQDAFIQVRGTQGSADFELDVGFGSISGALRGAVRGDGSVSIGLAGEPTDPPPVMEIRDALQFPELLSVYYRSGHVLVDGRIWTRQLPRGGFSRWRFEDFANCDITREKPTGKTPQEIHAAIGEDGDRSIFGWVVNHYAAGWLICDDGPGEIADFLHIGPNGALTFIHVKGANSASPLRRVAATAYEVVASQAVKNLVFTDSELLRDALETTSVTKPASWTDGVRVDDRAEFLEALALRDATDDVQVVIVQPHLSESIYKKLGEERTTEPPGDELLRLFRLEGLLLSTRATVVATNADLEVIGAKQ